MTKRRDLEAEIIDFFLLAPEAEARLVFKIVRGLVKQRGLLADKPTAAKPRLKRARAGGPTFNSVHAQE